ncbi:FG-GAP repeat domain-containing protein [Streptomyces venezuelae]|uniref:FG-GAP repeat domain-containing protein n=1 Tax=Streptomyces venezuelae TaxID=54571 RepID=UPI00278C235B|nr:VCBS repeat-containing protein [Streptomyces venezuelae]
MQFRSTGTRSTRLAAAVTAVLAVTALGAGTLATAPTAFAATAPAPAAAPAEAGETAALPVFPEGTQLSSVGNSGFITYSFASDTTKKLLWTPYDGSTPIPLQEPEDGWITVGADDVLVVARDSGALTLRNMAQAGAPEVAVDLGALHATYVTALSPTSVLAQVTKEDGTAELHVVTKDGAATNSRRIEGLPADAADFSASRAHDGAVLVGYETGPAGARTGGRALVDLAAGTAGTRYPAADSGTSYFGLEFSASHLSWFGYESGFGDYIASVDRETGETKRTGLGRHLDEPFSALVGDWLVRGTPTTPVEAVSLATGETRRLLDSGSVARTAADGTAVVYGASAADGKGLFRVELADGAPKVTKVADEKRVVDLRIEQVDVPDSVNLDLTGGRVTMSWTLSHREAYLDVRVTNTVTDQVTTERVYAPAEGNRFTYTWDGTVDGADAPNGRYAVEAEAKLLDGTGEPVYQGWLMNVTRTANPHDFTDNGSTDVLARDAAGVLWRDDLRDRPVDGRTETAGRVRIGGGWGAYKQIEAVGNLAGGATGDLVALDGSGVLWHYLGKGDGTFAPRVQIGGGWGVYDKLTGGSDLDGDGRADLLATDTTGALWFYKGTGDAVKPFAPRTKVGGGWGIFNQLTAVGNVTGTALGDLVARDKDGVLWLYQGTGPGTFAPRVRVGGGWGTFSQLVGAGDVDNDGRPDLIAYGPTATYVYRSTGSVSSPFARQATTLYAGEGTKFNNVL